MTTPPAPPPYAPYPPPPVRHFIPPDPDDPVVARYNLRSTRAPMLANCAATSKRYAAATAFLAGHCALAATTIAHEAHSVLDTATGKSLE